MIPLFWVDAYQCPTCGYVYIPAQYNKFVFDLDTVLCPKCKEKYLSEYKFVPKIEVE